MEFTKLHTVDEITDAIVAAVGLPMSPLKAKRERAARLADLYEMRARLFADAAKAAGDQIPVLFVHAANMAAGRDMDQMRFFRREAGAR
jgi:hypothetical protein